MPDVTITTLPADVLLTDALDNVLIIDAPNYGDGQPWGAEALVEVISATGSITFAVGQVVSADSSNVDPGQKFVVTLGGAPDGSKRLNFKGGAGDVFRVTI